MNVKFFYVLFVCLFVCYFLIRAAEKLVLNLKQKKEIREKEQKEAFKKIFEMPVIVRDNSSPSGLKVVNPFSDDCFRRPPIDDDCWSFLYGKTQENRQDER